VSEQFLSQGPADIANAGGLSPYGTMGQGGNVSELEESAYDGVNNSSAEERGLRGGAWYDPALFLGSRFRSDFVPFTEDFYFVGFRVAAVPESVPEQLDSRWVLGALVIGFALWRRRHSH